jgi:hypothetical protein
MSLGNSLRDFEQKTCSLFQTRELEREQAARQRRQQKVNKGKQESNGAQSKAAAPGNTTRKPKSLNLKTYKLHALGDYVSTIRRYGTTDSYSTQTVSDQPVSTFLTPLTRY